VGVDASATVVPPPPPPQADKAANRASKMGARSKRLWAWTARTASAEFMDYLWFDRSASMEQAPA